MDIFGELLYLLTSRKNQIVVLSKFKIGMLTREIVNVAGKGLTAGDMGGAGGPFAVYLVAIFASEMGKAVSKDLERACCRWATS